MSIRTCPLSLRLRGGVVLGIPGGFVMEISESVKFRGMKEMGQFEEQVIRRDWISLSLCGGKFLKN